ncbi:MAG: acetate kinase, partial [Cardiobacteriales bacterium]
TQISGLAERLGEGTGKITFKHQGEKRVDEIPDANHEKALAVIVKELGKHQQYDVIAVGHRVVHGGEFFSQSCLVDENTLDRLKECSNLAPLHNPANMAGIRAAQKAYPHLPQSVVFDTAFHQTLPEENYLYAIPYGYYREYGIRRYGFHGTSYRYISRTVPRYNGGIMPEKMIVAHLGNGASVCAIKEGQAVATSMGLTPLDGLIQGTRCGAIDPSIVSFLVEKTGKDDAVITDELWKKSGLLGLSELSNDCRELEEKAQAGDAACQRALSVFVARLTEVIGGYAGLMNGVDALVFTGGIGENSTYLRAQTVANFTYLGFALSTEHNEQTVRGKDGNIATADSRPIWVIPTDEELMIVEDTLELI